MKEIRSTIALVIAIVVGLTLFYVGRSYILDAYNAYEIREEERKLCEQFAAGHNPWVLQTDRDFDEYYKALGDCRQMGFVIPSGPESTEGPTGPESEDSND